MLKENTNFEVSTILCWTWLPTWSQMSFYLFDVQVWTTDRAIWATFSRLQFILFPSPTFSPHLDVLIAKFPQTPPNPRNTRIISTFSNPNELEIQLMQSCFGFMDRRNGQTFSVWTGRSEQRPNITLRLLRLHGIITPPECLTLNYPAPGFLIKLFRKQAKKLHPVEKTSLCAFNHGLHWLQNNDT